MVPVLTPMEILIVSENKPNEEIQKPEGLHVTQSIFIPKKVVDSLDIRKFSREKFINGRGDKHSVAEVAQSLLDFHGIPVKSEERFALQQALIGLLQSRKKKHLPAGFEDRNDLYELVKRVTPVTNFKGGEIFFLDSETNELVELSEEVYMSVNDMEIGNRKQLITSSRLAVVEFNPNSKKKIYSQELHGVGAPTLNLYDDPLWMKHEPTSPHIPELLEDLFINAFPNLEDREYVYKWFYRATCATKNETILCLLGSQGIGKDFIVSLLAHGVGTNFFEKADQSILADKFNSQVKYCRLLFLDETKVSSTVEENKLKGLTSTNISYQAKGQDATTIESFINIVLANNNKDALPVKPGDRRYSIPQLGSKRLELYFEEKYGKSGPKKLKQVHEYIYQGAKDIDGNKKTKPHDDIINFFHWLRNKYEDDITAMDGNTPYQKDYYYELVTYNMSEWQKRIYEHISNPKNFPITYLKDLKKGLDDQASKTFPSSARTIEKFFDLYPHLGKYNMATLETMKEGKTDKVIALTDKYLEFLHPDNFREKIAARDRVLSGGPLEIEREVSQEDSPIIVEDMSEDSDDHLL